MLKATIRQQADQDWESRDDPQAETPSGVRWKLLVSGERTPPEALTMSIAEIAPGGKLFSHRHSHAETYYITSGTGLINIDDTESDIGPGAAILIPGNARHETICTSDVPLASIFIFTFPCDSFDEVIYHYEE